ncbi:MAG TPA: glycosyltransferase family 2 protein [Mycobacteriales bacterium]|nr:glycosyltransferase family 2 protein [Mycobacteriales bacterium]
MTGSIDCTVVIPVFNRGEALTAGIDSLRAQTLGEGRVEIIYVDDGSDDGRTPKLIDQVVANTPNARVFHEPASGSPGRPRNVGLANAQGDYVFFADHDDWFDQEALERLVGFARENSSDVVIGKVVAYGRRAVIPRIFRESRARIPAAEAMISLTPHKLFRREFLLQHGIRAPEGKRRLEDHEFVTHAYLHAQTISVYADRICYHHNHPGDDGNFSQSPVDIEVYTRSNRDVIALICRHTDGDPERRDAMLQRPVVHELLKKAGPRRMRPADAEGEALKHHVLRTALVEDVPDTVIDRMAAFPRATAKALRDDDPEAVRRIDDRSAALSLRAELVDLRANGSTWTIDYRIGLERDGELVRFEPGPGRETWWLDEPTLARGDADRAERQDELLAVDVEILVACRRTSEQWHLRGTSNVRLSETRSGGILRRRGDAETLQITGNATIDLADVGGAQIGFGVWDVLVRAEVLGVALKTRLGVIDESALPSPLPRQSLRNPKAHAAAFVTEAKRLLAVEVGRRRGDRGSA